MFTSLQYLKMSETSIVVHQSGGASSSDAFSDLALRDFTMTKYESVLEETAEDAAMSGVERPTRKVYAPLWLRNMYGELVNEIQHLGDLLLNIKKQGQDPSVVAFHIVDTY